MAQATDKQRYTRAERLQQIRELESRGITDRREQAEQLGISVSTVRSYLSDPSGRKNKLRRERYRGSCVSCGGPTDGSNGRGKASRRCLACVRRGTTKYWTRERIIEAIRTWAEEHDGKPPTATQWLLHRGGRDMRFPYASTVFVGGRNRNAPFKAWADAIEAAGFPRPRSGHYERTDEWRQKVRASRESSDTQFARKYMGKNQRKLLDFLSDGKARSASEIQYALGFDQIILYQTLARLVTRGYLIRRYEERIFGGAILVWQISPQASEANAR